MSVHHHHDDDKEFRAWMSEAYDLAMVPVLLLYVSLALPRTGMTTAVYTTALAEAAAIWSAHGVVVRAAAAGMPQTDAIVIRVVVQHRPASSGTQWRGPLASVR